MTDKREQIISLTYKLIENVKEALLKERFDLEVFDNSVTALFMFFLDCSLDAIKDEDKKEYAAARMENIALNLAALLHKHNIEDVVSKELLDSIQSATATGSATLH